jgi:hypothetical protein
VQAACSDKALNLFLSLRTTHPHARLNFSANVRLSGVGFGFRRSAAAAAAAAAAAIAAKQTVCPTANKAASQFPMQPKRKKERL